MPRSCVSLWCCVSVTFRCVSVTYPALHLTAGTPLGLMQDSSSGAMLLWSGDALHEVSLSNEGKDMWRTYLDYQVCVRRGHKGSCVCVCVKGDTGASGLTASPT